jgi:tetratricopeptide (TPR) repeat protein
MSTEELIDLGYSLLLDGGIEQAELLLDLAVERDDGRNGQRSHRRSGERAVVSAADALFKLGHALRMQGDWSRATDRYKAAHRLVPGNIEITFYLGMSYRQSGQPEKAVGILEEGLDNLPANKPEFVSDYFVQLGLAYRESDAAAKAIPAFQQAQVWLGKLQTARPEQESFIQDLLDQSLRSIDADP